MCGREASDFQTYDLPVSIIRHFESCFPHVEEVTLHGWGEGTLHPRFIEILKILNSYPLLRKYFVTNASTLPKIRQAIFDHHVDVIAVSLDGATVATNDSIRKGGSFERETTELKKLIKEKKNRNLDYPHINIVFAAMQKNIHELPDMVTLARDLGVLEVKIVYLTVFKEDLLNESLLDRQKEVRESFGKASFLAKRFNIDLILPEIQGESKAGILRHKACPFPWRDIFIGSDGFVRLCQSSPQKIANISQYQTFEELWNSKKMQELRRNVNDKKLMPKQCYYCYHSTCANWNLRHSFYQLEQGFAPEWEVRKDREISHV
jgi:radical SAM protein with 4Fe4S-binding SPASM domain